MKNSTLLDHVAALHEVRSFDDAARIVHEGHDDLGPWDLCSERACGAMQALRAAYRPGDDIDRLFS